MNRVSMLLLFALLTPTLALAAPADDLTGQVRQALLDEAKQQALEQFAQAVATRAPRLAGALRGLIKVSKVTGPVLDLLEATPVNDVRAQANEGLLRLSNEILLTQTLLKDLQVDYNKYQKGQDPRHGANWYANHLAALQERIKAKKETAQGGCDAVKIEEPQEYQKKYKAACEGTLGSADALVAIDGDQLRKILPARSPLD
jgi:hypothetical protein